MLGLLQAYGSDESDSESEKEVDNEEDEKQPVTKLPRPFELPSSALGSEASTSAIDNKSVFVNPYTREDQEKKALLEKHVKMISTDVRSVNGKKICWNYRKKKCRFGHNCKYAHDSDLQTTDIPAASENSFRQAPLPESFDLVDEATMRASGKKRPGLSQTIVPGKKAMKKYYEQKTAK